MISKKKILFVHPLGQNWKPGDRNVARIVNIMAPLGLLSLAAWLVEAQGTLFRLKLRGRCLVG